MTKNKNSLNSIIDAIVSERSISRQALINAIETAISDAAQRKARLYNLHAVFDTDKGAVTLTQTKTVKENVDDPEYEITPEQAAKHMSNPEPGAMASLPYSMPELGRLAAMATRRMMKKTVEEIKAVQFYGGMLKNKWKMVTAAVRGRIDETGLILCDVAEMPAELLRKEQAFREKFKNGELIKVLVIDVVSRDNDSVYILSRTHPMLLRFLLEMEVPEIVDGLVEIKSVARDTAGRSKVAVFSANSDIDAVGTCIGPDGSRVQRITKELKGENIDVIKWFDEPEKFIAASLTPAKVESVKCNPASYEAFVKLESSQRSIAVGKGGLNIRLASRLTRWTINIE
ncbi:MAG: transcription termination/antitermination protein NusA [bacterium]|nr:MAG: transcription termination/antitermination protein NusA [bacterium]